jgi:ABC-type transport system substrate-binding protein
MRRTSWSAFAFLVVGMLVLASCTQQAASPTEAPEGTPAGTATAPAANFAPEINQALDAEVGLMSNAASDVPTARITALIYDFLYVLDDTLTPQPELAADLCEVSEDETLWTCTIVDNATFHNGDPITAEDVAYSYQLAISPSCTYNPSVCLEPFLESATATDETTIEFQLIDPYAPFATVILPGIGIESKAVIEAAYEEFTGASAEFTPEDLTAQADALQAAVDSEDPATCEGALAEPEATLNSLGATLPERSVFETDEGFDACGYAGALQPLLASAADALTQEGIDAVAAAYQLLGFNRDPVGSGPYMVESFDPGQGVVLSAFEDYFQGAPATPTINMPIFKDVAVAAQALVAGELDWVNDLTPDARAVVEGEESVTMIEYNDFGFFGMFYQMHESLPLPDGSSFQGFFFDKALRKAVQVCIDKATLVETATEGNGVPVESDIPPASWAFNPDVVAPERNVEEGRRLIEEDATVHTWTAGDDGIYVNEAGERLSSIVYVRAGQQDRIDFMNLLATQVAECGIEIVVQPQDFQTILIPSLDYPHIAPGQAEPWHAYFGGFGLAVDPDPFSLFHSSQCTSPDLVSAFNYICFQNPEVDELIEAGLQTSDQAERTEIYKQYQEIMFEEQPVLFAWANINADAVDANMAYSDGPLEEGTPQWGWQIHKLVIVENGG